MLIIVKNRNVTKFFEAALNDKALWAFDIFKIDPTKGAGDISNRLNDLIGINCIEFDINGINIGKALEEN